MTKKPLRLACPTVMVHIFTAAQRRNCKPQQYQFSGEGLEGPGVTDLQTVRSLASWSLVTQAARLSLDLLKEIKENI